MSTQALPLTDTEILAKDEETRQSEVVAKVEDLLNEALKGINTWRNKRANTHELFVAEATKTLEENKGGNTYASFNFASKRSGVKEMGIYILSDVTLHFENGTKKTLKLKSKMKTWNQSESTSKELNSKELVAA